MTARRSRLRWCLLGLCLWVSAGIAQASKEPAAELYFRPAYDAELLNPGGNLLATLASDEDGQAVVVTDMSRRVKRRVFDTADLKVEEKGIVDLQWIDGSALLVVTVERRKGIAGLADTKQVRRAFIVLLPEDLGGGAMDVRALQGGGTVVSALPTEFRKILVARSGSVSRVYRIDVAALAPLGQPIDKTRPIDGGQFVRRNEVARLDGYVLRWLVDAAGVVRAGTTLARNGEIALWYRDGAAVPWVALKRWQPPRDEADDPDRERIDEQRERELKLLLPLALGEEDRVFYVLDRYQRDTRSLYRYDYRNQSQQLLFTHPDHDIIQLQFDYTGSRLLAAMYLEQGELHYHYLDQQSKAIQRRLEQRLHVPVAITGVDLQQRIYTALVRAADDPGTLYRYDSATDRLDPIHRQAPWLQGRSLAKVRLGSVQSHGLNIDYLLTLPPAQRRPPLVVVPHGGPIGISDERNYSGVVQYLVSRGLAVLQVNYRGSGGYGQHFMELGKREFGERILDDIHAAVRQVVAGGAVDPHARCIAGGSYGGYAALMLAIRYPEEYDCVASLAGVTDVGLLFDGHDPEHKNAATDHLWQYIGDPGVDYDYFKSISPVFQAQSLKAPLFLAHGDRDRRVDPEHAYRLKLMLDAYRKPYQWQLLSGQGHGFASYRDAAAYYVRLADFIVGHIGAEPSPLAAAAPPAVH